MSLPLSLSSKVWIRSVLWKPVKTVDELKRIQINSSLFETIYSDIVSFTHAEGMYKNWGQKKLGFYLILLYFGRPLSTAPKWKSKLSLIKKYFRSQWWSSTSRGIDWNVSFIELSKFQPIHLKDYRYVMSSVTSLWHKRTNSYWKRESGSE